MVRIIALALCFFLLISCAPATQQEPPQSAPKEEVMNGLQKKIYLAGGCFWGVEAYMQKLPGVIEATSGYANGHTENPTYQDVVTGETGFAETVEVVYDPQIMTLPVLISHYFRVIEPTVLNRQGNDIGTQYRTGIYYTDPSEEEMLQKMLDLLQEDERDPVVVELLPLDNFYQAEDYHQEYLQKNPTGYCHINLSLADERFIPKYPYLLEDLEEKKQSLSEAQKHIGLDQGTEPPFTHPLWDAMDPGVYVDIVSAQPLFLSTDKYECGCGWASFHTAASPDVVIFKEDTSYGMIRTEVISALSELHLGHIFNDGPREHGGMRYCINGEVLRFVPYDAMDEEGYGYLKPFIVQEAP